MHIFSRKIMSTKGLSWRSASYAGVCEGSQRNRNLRGDVDLVGGRKKPLEAEGWKEVKRMSWGIKLSSKAISRALIYLGPSDERQKWCLVLDLSISPSYCIRSTVLEPSSWGYCGKLDLFVLALHVTYIPKILKRDTLRWQFKNLLNNTCV